MELTLPESTDRALNYVSCIRINGRPILPPLMTSLRRQEMAEYRRQATIAETRILRRKIERAHQLWEKRNDKLTLSNISLDIKDSKQCGTEENINTTYSQPSKNKTEFDDASSNKMPCRNHSFPKMSSKIWYETDNSNFCDDSNHQAFINSQGFNFCYPVVHYTAINEIPLSSDCNVRNSSCLIHSSSYTEQDKQNREDRISCKGYSCDNGIVITKESTNVISNEMPESSFETDTDSTLLSIEQSTDLEKYFDGSVDIPATNNVLNTVPTCSFNEKSTDKMCVLNCSSGSLNTTLCPSLEDSSETLIPIAPQNSDTEEKECEAQVNPSNCDFSSASVDFTSVAEDNTTSTTRCHVRRSSYTLDEPSPALMLAMEDSNKPTLDLPDNFASIPLNSEEITKDNSSVAKNEVSQFVDSTSLLNSQIIQDTLDTEIATINNDISACSLCDSQNNELSETVKSKSKTNSDQFKFSCLDNKTSEYESSCDMEQSRMMLTMKETMDQLFKEQEKNFESARKRLSQLHQQQMVKLLARQNQQWQRLLEEEASEEFDQLPMSEQIYEVSDGNAVNSLNQSKNMSTEGNINDDVKKMKASVPEIRIESLPRDHYDIMKTKVLTPDMQYKFNKLSAAAKGYLTRRLMKSERVQRIIQTIKDTLICAMRFHQETPIKKGRVTEKDAELHKRLITQLTAACYELHDVFFKLTVKEKMEIIRQTREKMKRNSTDLSDSLNNRKCLSNATLKVLERKKLNKSSIGSDTIEGKKFPAKYCFKALKSSENASNVLKLPSRRGNVPPARSSRSPPVRKYAHQTSPKQDFQKATRKTTPARKRLLDNNMNQKR